MTTRETRLRVSLAALITVALVIALAWAVQSYRHSSSSNVAVRTTTTTKRAAATTTVLATSASVITTDASTTADPSTTTSTTRTRSKSSGTSSATPSAGVNRAAHPVTTPGGMWWGVDSSGPITPAAIANVRDWYIGHHKPQFWGRYVSGDYAVSAKELAYARSQGIYVYLLVNDANCSVCSDGHDVCGHDMTAGQARSDAHDAIAAATKVGVPDHTILFKDIEQVGSCRGEPTATYLDTWYRTLRDTNYRTGFYGNVHKQTYDFPRAYCATVAVDPAFRQNVSLDMNEDEPQLGAPQGTVGPGNAPAFAPHKPSCAPSSAVKLWQYGESTSPDNYTDIDQARPDIDGVLAPDGGVTGG